MARATAGGPYAPPDRTDRLSEFGELFREFLEKSLRSRRPDSDRSLIARLREHLGREPVDVPVVRARYPHYDHANVHLALERWFGAEEREYELLGIAGQNRRMESLSELVESADQFGNVQLGTVDYAYVPVSADEELAVVAFGLYLGWDGVDPYAVLLRGPEDCYGENEVQLEVLAPTREHARAMLAALGGIMREHNVFRGKVISFEGSPFSEGVGPFKLHARPGLGREDIVLPFGLLERIERQVVGVARRRDTLLAHGQHLRRGLLLYGPPGTGKTHSVRYLLARLPEFTVIVLSGTSIRFVGAACALARMLEPALVVLEDCDLVAEARDLSDDEQPLLFQVLNEMDGLGDDADVAFLLTTNRADLLEPALAQRPGRVDMAVEIPLPDAAARRALFALYGGRLGLPEDAVAEAVRRTEGTTASFAKEAVRRTVLFAAERDEETPTPSDLSAALDELLGDNDRLTRRLLGVRGEDDAYEDEDDEEAYEDEDGDQDAEGAEDFDMDEEDEGERGEEGGGGAGPVRGGSVRYSASYRPLRRHR
ncbi:ATP-binding protein [Streptomyces sp. ODS28]|uniref:ATP-binding protein n=1 Tax=Streptomyces sp. ODS28 TaxID=3136688 RepID=UPI0031EEB0FE